MSRSIRKTPIFGQAGARSEAAAAKLPPKIVVIPASGPLVSVQVRDALDALLEADPGLRPIVTDLVQFEVSAFPNRFHDVQAVLAFLERHNDRISIQKTTIGKFAIPAMKDQLKRGEAVVWQKDLGDLAINCYIKAIGKLDPGEPTWMLISDEWFDEKAYVVPGNVRLMSVAKFLTWYDGHSLDGL